MEQKKSVVYERISFFIVFIYICFVLWGQYSLLDSVFPLLPIAIGIIAASAVLAKLLLKWCSGWHISQTEHAPGKKELKKLALITFGVSFFLLGLGYYSRFPGIYCMDSVCQLNECLTGEYNDWHPLLQTLLTFFIPMKIGGVWLIELIQIICYCGALTFMICSLRFYRCPWKICILILAYLMIQPDTTYILLFPMKDCSFTIITMLLTACYLHIVCTKGTWLKKNINLIFLSVTLITGTIIRHNAILFTLPLLAAVLYYSKKAVKRCVVLVLSVVLGIVIIKIPVYKAFHMPENDNRVTETMGLCFVVMGNVLSDCPELLSDDVKEFLYDVQDQETWELQYSLGSWNLVKSGGDGADFDLIEETGRKKILDYTLDTIGCAPDQTLRAFFAVTGMVWQIDGDMNWQGSQKRYDTNYVGSRYDDTPATDELDRYSDGLPGGVYMADVSGYIRDIIEDSAFRYIFCFVGLLNMLMLLVCMSRVRKEKSLRTFLHILPVFAYSYGTALLLSAYDWRFFYYTYGCFFVIMFIMLRDKTSEEDI